MKDAGTVKAVSDSTVRRLSAYYRRLSEMEEEGIEIASSKELATRNGVTPAQVRKDFSLFGKFGRRGQGYTVKDLKEAIAKILGVGRGWNVALVGLGKVGAALFHYKEFRKQGFNIAAVFDNDPAKQGSRIGDAEIYAPERLKEVVQEKEIGIGIVAVPGEAAQAAVDALVTAGVRAILSFPMRRVVVPEGIHLRYVNMAVEMEGLSFLLVNQGSKRHRSSSGGVQ
jgi:redox-sensing transcriptional repressor